MPTKLNISLFQAIALTTLLFAPAAAPATVIFTNITTPADNNGGSFVCSNIHGQCPVTESSAWVAEQFTSSDNFLLTDIQLLLSAAGAPPTFNASLYTDNVGGPGALIGQIGTSQRVNVEFPRVSYITVNASGAFLSLVSGTKYWIVLSPAEDGSLVFWANGGSPSAPYAASFDNGATWITPGNQSLQFQVDGTPLAQVPEPASWSLLFGTGALATVLRRKRRAR